MNYFDYEILAPCEYEVPVKGCNETTGCGEPACYKVWWGNYGPDAISVCQEHLDLIKKAEGML